MPGSANASAGLRSWPRSSPTTLRPALANSRAMMLPVQPMPTSTASTSFNLRVMTGPSRKIGDGLRVLLVALAAISLDFFPIGGGQAGIADHAPGRLVAIAAIDRIGEE